VQAIILGSAAGGGVPQWNCRCRVCEMARSGDPRASARTQSSLAVSDGGKRWLLVNASPDLRQQIASTPQLQPRDGPRGSPIAAVLLTNGDVDHVAGLLSLREGQAFVLYATASVLEGLSANPIFNVMSPRFVTRTAVELETPFRPLDGLSVALFAVPGKVPLWREDGEPEIGQATEETVGVMIEAAGRRLAYVPGCARVTDEVRARVDGVDALLFDGTVYADDDLIRAGVGEKTGWRMGHVPMAGEHGSIRALSPVKADRRIFIHINNTNPALVEDADERRCVDEAGWIVARDGMVVNL
jgi:pyrroloquinoline quinone biosynthesis protein B